MTTYHRGRKQSLYRKHAFATALAFTSASTAVYVNIRQAGADGLILIKSIRGLVLLPSLANGQYATGWMGYGRSTASDTTPNFDIDQSDVFGVQTWACGPGNDQLVSLPLKGITLSAGEAFWLVGRMEGRSSNSVSQAALWQGLYAIRTTDST